MPVDEPIAWVSQTVCIFKKKNKIRLCLDPQELNKLLLREHYTMSNLDDILHELSDSTAIFKADLASGYWYIKLNETSIKLTTFQHVLGVIRGYAYHLDYLYLLKYFIHDFMQSLET